MDNKIIKDLIEQAKGDLINIAKGEVPAVAAAVEQYLKNGEDRFSALVNEAANGGDLKFVLERLKEEKDIFRSQVQSFAVVGKVAGQNIFNNIQALLINALTKTIFK